MADFHPHLRALFALGLPSAWRASFGLAVVGMAVFHLCNGFALGRALARPAFDLHIHVGIVRTVFRQRGRTGLLCEYLVREIGDRVWCKPPAICTRGFRTRALSGMGLGQRGFAGARFSSGGWWDGV